jgi:hypothetical protein
LHRRSTTEVVKLYTHLWVTRFDGSVLARPGSIDFQWGGRQATRSLFDCRRALASKRKFTEFMKEVAEDVRWVEPGLR